MPQRIRRHPYNHEINTFDTVAYHHAVGQPSKGEVLEKLRNKLEAQLRMRSLLRESNQGKVLTLGRPRSIVSDNNSTAPPPWKYHHVRRSKREKAVRPPVRPSLQPRRLPLLLTCLVYPTHYSTLHSIIQPVPQYLSPAHLAPTTHSHSHLPDSTTTVRQMPPSPEAWRLA